MVLSLIIHISFCVFFLVDGVLRACFWRTYACSVCTTRWCFSGNILIVVFLFIILLKCQKTPYKRLFMILHLDCFIVHVFRLFYCPRVIYNNYMFVYISGFTSWFDGWYLWFHDQIWTKNWRMRRGLKFACLKEKGLFLNWTWRNKISFYFQDDSFKTLIYLVSM